MEENMDLIQAKSDVKNNSAYDRNNILVAAKK